MIRRRTPAAMIRLFALAGRLGLPSKACRRPL